MGEWDRGENEGGEFFYKDGGIWVISFTKKEGGELVTWMGVGSNCQLKSIWPAS